MHYDDTVKVIGGKHVLFLLGEKVIFQATTLPLPIQFNVKSKTS